MGAAIDAMQSYLMDYGDEGNSARNLTPEVRAYYQDRAARISEVAISWPFRIGVHNIGPGTPVPEHVGQLQAQLECCKCGQTIGVLLSIGPVRYNHSNRSIHEHILRHIGTRHPEAYGSADTGE